MENIAVRGARTHNLKNISLNIPRDRLVVITGLSGSGKSSLAFDTLYAEGQRRYVESLSAYARQFLSLMSKPDVDSIDGLSPAISIEQKSTSHNPRSTVGTITEIHDYLRLLYARIGEPHCCGQPIQSQTVSQMVDQILEFPPDSRLMILAPVVRNRKGEHEQLFKQLRSQGFVRIRLNGQLHDLEDVPALDKKRANNIEVVIDRLKIRPEAASRLAESLETALGMADGQVIVSILGDSEHPGQEQLFSEKYACPSCGSSFPALEPRMFSFNNPAGACPSCDGLGELTFFDPELVIPNPELSLPEGAIRAWERRYSETYYQMLESLAAHYQFDLQQPWRDLPEPARQIILYGSNGETLPFRYGPQVRKHAFEGVIPNLERRYRETDSSFLREELGRYQGRQVCPKCEGSRLRAEARQVLIGGMAIHEVSHLAISQTSEFFENIDLQGQRAAIGERILREIGERLQFLLHVGLDYLSLDRSADTLSGGEAQRIRLASQIGAGLVGVMYVLDEPSIGLHQRDNDRLLATLRRLRDLGNSVIVVEHDEEAIRAADHVIDVGPGAGIHGGQIVAQGTPAQIENDPESLTGKYLSGKLEIAVPHQRVSINHDRQIRLRGASGHNLKQVDVDIPLGLLTCVTGVSGSGKSTLINETLYPAAARKLHQAKAHPSPYQDIQGLEYLDKVINIDQSPIGRTPRSNPATYTGLFTPIRELFAGTAESRARGYGPGRFSFNVKGGRCEACEGEGVIKVEMHFLPDIYVPCDVCAGKRYNRETLEITYKGKSIDQILNMTVEDAFTFFEAIPSVARKLKTLMEVGLGYIELGQSATTLSGGEAQRIKLAKELARRDTGATLYILDEPTTGLHFHDIALLLQVLHRLRDAGNTLVIIEHNLDVVKTADWVIDLGPEGGDRGGEILAEGTPESIAEHPYSHTGKYLKKILQRTEAGLQYHQA